MIKVFADGASLQSITNYVSNPFIKGFTTNPSLLKKAEVTDYISFINNVLELVKDKPISFEVLSQKPDEMIAQALKISSRGENAWVKIPIINTSGEYNTPVILYLLAKKVNLNLTCITTKRQIEIAMDCTNNKNAIISIFAGRIADTLVDPCEIIKYAVSLRTEQEILWASTRELYNIKQAEDCGADIITVNYELLSKMNKVGIDLAEQSLDAVRMFDKDAKESGLTL